MVLIGGEAGVGKSSLVNAFIAGLPTGTAVIGHCVPLGGQGLAYAPFHGVLRELAERYGIERVRSWVGFNAAALGAILPEVHEGRSGDALEARLRTYEAVADLFERVSAMHPLVVVLEDLHWADCSTTELVAFLSRSLGRHRVLLVGTFRSDELTPVHPLRSLLAELGRLPSTQRIDVPRLNQVEVAEMLSRLCHGPPGPEVVEQIFRRSDGNPFFVDALVSCQAGGDNSCWSLPQELRDVLLLPLARLSADAGHLIRTMEGGGPRVPHDLLATVAQLPPDRFDTAIREAVDAHVLIADRDGYRFRHALLSEAVATELLPGEWARLHERFAMELEAKPSLLPDGTSSIWIAHSYWEAGRLAEAFLWSAQAAGSLGAAHGEKLRLYERILSSWSSVEDPEAVAGPRVELLTKAAEAARDSGDLERCLTLVDQAIEATDPADGEGMAYRMRLKARQMATMGRPGAIDLLNQAKELLSEGHSLVRATVLDTLSTLHMLSGSYVLGLEIGMEAREVAQAVGDTALESSAWNTIGCCLVHMGRVEAGIDAMGHAGQLAADSPRTRVRYFVNYSIILWKLGRYRQGVALAEEGLEVARELGLMRSLGAGLRCNQAAGLIELGRIADADAALKVALSYGPPRHYEASLLLLQAVLHVWRDELEDAERLLDDLCCREWRSSDRIDVAVSCTRLHLAMGRWREAIGTVTAGLGDATKRFQAHTHFVGQLAAATLARARDESAIGEEEFTERAAQLRRMLNEVAHWGRLSAWHQVIEADLAPTPERWRQAVSAVAAMAEPNVPLTLYANRRLVDVLAQNGSREAAFAAYHEATARLAEAPQQRLEARELTTVAERHGIAVSASGTYNCDAGGDEEMASPGVRLTQREREVLVLVAAGRSNREIGAALFISAKTASVHVSNIIAKLGVSGRTEAATTALGLGLIDRPAHSEGTG